MKTLLIPTDFNPESLHCIPALTSRYANQRLNIVLVHMMSVTDNIGELLMLSRRSAEYRHISQEFYNRCAKLKQQYAGKLENIDIKFFYGNTVAAFKNFLEANEVDSIVMLENYPYQKLTKTSIDPSLLINRSGYPVESVRLEQTEVSATKVKEELLEETV
jgi:hypothetical protein